MTAASKTGDEAAFPQIETEEDGFAVIHEGGLTKREWFAGQALGQLSVIISNWDGPADHQRISDTASVAVRLADALIAELDRTKP